ncbi:MAG: Rrf2 family transcriptional regulator [Bifidobacterium castoris]|nr:Rrf2 family transcriptional regulator [Bifidobacterium castoris]
MRISSRFPIAVHVMLCIAHFGATSKVTSSFIADSVNVNPVIIRQVIGKLKDAGLVTVDAGIGGAHVARPLESITLLDVYRAIEGPGRQLFGFHDNPNPQCPVGRNIHTLLDGELDAAQHALETQLGQTTLAQLNDRLDTLTKE